MSRKTSTNNSIESTNELLSTLIKKLEELDFLQREVLIAVRSITEQDIELPPTPTTDNTTGGLTVVAERQSDTSTFKLGDQVQVTNRIRHPFGSPKRTTGNSCGIVVRITRNRVHIKLSDTGVTVQRAPSNVKHQHTASNSR